MVTRLAEISFAAMVGLALGYFGWLYGTPGGRVELARQQIEQQHQRQQARQETHDKSPLSHAAWEALQEKWQREHEASEAAAAYRDALHDYSNSLRDYVDRYKHLPD